jgi:hypothetical protein
MIRRGRNGGLGEPGSGSALTDRTHAKQRPACATRLAELRASFKTPVSRRSRFAGLR